MERHDAMTRRPSLLAGGPEPTNRAPRRERILPSIDTAPPARPARQRPRPWLLPAGLLVLAAALVLWWQRPAGTPVEVPAAIAVPHPQPTGAAAIIEDAAPPTAVAPGPMVAAPLPPAPAGAGGPDSTAGSQPGEPAPASPFASVAGSDGQRTRNPFTGSRVPAATHAPARAPGAAGPADADTPALLATLLDHIHATAEPEPGMDRRVDRLARDGAVASPQVPGAEFRSWQIQLNLRECPPANTAEGVACRKEICEVYAGRDPACPAG